MRLDAEGWTLCPTEVSRRLEMLGFSGDVHREAGFLPAFAWAFDAAKRYELLIWRRAYLARYLRIPPSETERMPVALIWEYVAALSELIAKENAAAAGGVASAAESGYV